MSEPTTDGQLDPTAAPAPATDTAPAPAPAPATPASTSMPPASADPAPSDSIPKQGRTGDHPYYAPMRQDGTAQ